MNEEKSDYPNALDYLAKEKCNERFRNGGAINRVWTLSTLIKYSNKQIKIYETESNISHYNEEIIKELSSFIWSKKGYLKILLDSFQKKSLFSDFVKDNYYTEKIKINLTNRKLLNKDDLEGHFILGDNSKFALSFYPNKESKIKTIVNFNEKKFSMDLNQFFEETFNNPKHSNPLKLLEKIV